MVVIVQPGILSNKFGRALFNIFINSNPVVMICLASILSNHFGHALFHRFINRNSVHIREMTH